MTPRHRQWLTRILLALVAVGVGLAVWQRHSGSGSPEGLASGNGRIEATEIDVAAKYAGRIAEILVSEGDFVTAGQVVARMDTTTLLADLRQAEAQLKRAESAVETARSQLAQRQSELAAAEALVLQREAELVAARKQAERTAELASRNAVSQQDADNDHARMLSYQAAVSAARAQVAAARAAVVTAKSQVASALSEVEAARALSERIRADIDDSDLTAPRDGRVQYLVARVGEVVAAGGRVINLVDLSDVYMTFFLPTAAAGRLELGSEARLILDAAPNRVIPARISFIADVAQFTPKTVETAVEREKLMFRVRAQIPPELLRKYITRVKTGLPGVAWVRLDPAVPWPAHLETGLVQ